MTFDDWWNDQENGCPTLVLDTEEQFARAVWDAANNVRYDNLIDALRKAVAWGDAASTHILYRENINWEFLDEARETLNANLNQPKPTQ
jgi:hypothetical protein